MQNLGGGEAIGEVARRDDSTDLSSPEIDDGVVGSVEVCSTSLRLITTTHLPLIQRRKDSNLLCVCFTVVAVGREGEAVV